jgi:hypothetical protein
LIRLLYSLAIGVKMIIIMNFRCLKTCLKVQLKMYRLFKMDKRSTLMFLLHHLTFQEIIFMTIQMSWVWEVLYMLKLGNKCQLSQLIITFLVRLLTRPWFNTLKLSILKAQDKSFTFTDSHLWKRFSHQVDL